ncbi:integrase arm-type DNA-binding domain-containing protein [Undibacterium amnicola]|uniref:Integrase arm-type DNA-binding domain-containing protein n=1 Tax=Undibacterium amnicola TaxID=1834038 RepID=A0ABR6XMU1_9BURK|nr:integrase arm-type DNA-binding domain-containing protein [Undibacterium amnicola]MBC3830736.1 integrase arm-type DNA-binding domain-containing protein [Undibacterium amnicola]
MPKLATALTDTTLRNAKGKDKPYKLSDGGGLFLLVNENGAKYWRMDYRFNGKRLRLAFGKYPDVSLVVARSKRADANELLASGIDPSETKRTERIEQTQHKETIQREASGLPLSGSFEEVALEWFETKIKPLSASHSNRTMAYLKNDLIPYLGKLPMIDIKAPALLECLRRVESRKNKQGKSVTETANRVREQMGQLWRYAIATGRAERDIATDLRGALEVHVQKNFSHITDPKLLGQLMRDVETYSGAPVTVAALRILPLVFTRPMELRTARWADINLETKEWRYFSTKTKIDHIVPLATQVVELLKALQPLTGMGEYVFGVRSGQRPLSEITINQALKSLGYGGDVIHPHGFRHTAATMLAELGWDENTIDRQLSHLAQGVKGVYQKAKYIEDRRKMMQAWADYLCKLKNGAAIIPIKVA